MRRWAASLGRVALTLVVVVIAAVIGWQLWVYYMEEPWTRDGVVRADVVGVAPDVSGLVSEVLVRDNQQVRKGEVLFRIDKERFTIALQQADAALRVQRARLQQAGRELDRYQALSNVEVSKQKQEQVMAAAEEAGAAYQQAMADRSLAQLNLDRADVTAPVNGTISNFEMRPGDYVTAGRAVAALVDSGTLYVAGYFEETKLPRIHVGDPASVRLMGESTVLHGHVQSIAGGIQDRERQTGSGLLASVNPTFSWVRLAQRIPVRVQIDNPPPEVRLLPGRTASVWIGREAR
ncbi:MAG TPA: HlyD family secretion protein [Acetobacteraceae bacterium]|nr:HlyD family secretion protein [Acetobacteraceae bacterium]